MSNVKETLVAARASIADPDCWGQGPDRDCYCVLDAMDDAQGTYGDLAAADLLMAFLPPDYGADPSNSNHPVAQFNDEPTTTHADVIGLLDRAIAAQA